MESEFDFCARRAAEEFLAAGRAGTAEERRVHRQLAERYAAVVRELIRKRGTKSEPPLPDPDPSNVQPIIAEPTKIETESVSLTGPDVPQTGFEARAA